MDNDVIIYVKNLKKYLLSSEKARELFLTNDIDLDDFINEVVKVATSNVKDGKSPQLTQSQYEKIRFELTDVEPIIPMMEIKGFPPFFLN